MTGVLFRTGSGPIHKSLLPGSPRFSIPFRHDSFSGGEKVEFSPLLHLEVNNNRRRISRAASEPQEIIRLRSMQTFPEDDDVVVGIGLLKFTEKCFDRMSWIPAVGSGGGFGFGSGRGGNNNSNNDNDNKLNKIGAHYQQMLKSNPNDPLLLRNYAKFLHEVEGDTVKAEEYYGRAILASPGDGDLLSLCGKLIWETQRDGERAQSYLDQAISVSPDDCMVMGSYAQFMWEAEEEGSTVSVPAAAQPLVAAF